MTKKRMNKVPEPPVSVTVTLSLQVIEELNEIAFRTGYNRTDIIREAIEHFLEWNDDQEVREA